MAVQLPIASGGLTLSNKRANVTDVNRGFPGTVMKFR
jgi:hypothetical protein